MTKINPITLKQVRRHGGGGGGLISMFFFFFFFFYLLVRSAVGHGHDNTPTPL